MVQIMGTTVPGTANEIRVEYALAISRALQEELGQSARAAKTIMRWTGASERAAKYWLAGSRAPSGWQLILMARYSDAILHEFLRMTGRDLLKVSIELAAAEASLVRATAIIRALRIESP
ncbi:hypothetical protein [Rhizobium lentis]|uniref:hypothetical protein n=1 Tax=Rhizobium lentis TaxID=1138194 RepID=UPI001C830C5A|nr:hypothetical protein [Rhizobium lentis]MBX4954736.1 hypothetical protein [Rhizobium lentis]MBX5034545.1 hypothetical protein [Rhizobium lentis]